MPSLRRITYTKPIPADAEIIDRKGKPFARFKDRRGKVIVAPIADDGKHVRMRSSKWYGKYRDADGNPCCVPLSTDKTAAQQMLTALVRKAELARAGCGDPFEDHRKTPLADHLKAYRRHLEAKGGTAGHAAKTCARVRAILDGCRFVFMADLSASAVAEFLHKLRQDRPRPPLPAGDEPLTKKELMEAVGGSAAALSRVLRRAGLEGTGNGKARRYPRAVAPLASLARLNARTDIRYQRRALDETELRTLLAAAGRSAVEFAGLTGADRRMLYAVAMATGFRAGELSALIPASFELDSDPPLVRVRAAYAKNRREAMQPIPRDLAAALSPYMATRPSGRAVWPGRWHKQAADMLRLDLAAAGIPYADPDGCVADFHALRHSYITLLARSGINPKLAQELARHSDIRLTMGVYTHIGLYDLAGAVGELPRLLPAPGGEAAELAATGTTGGIANKGTTEGKQPPISCPSACPSDDFRCLELSADENSVETGGEAEQREQTADLKPNESRRERLRIDDESGPAWIRTKNQGIMSPLLCR